MHSYARILALSVRWNISLMIAFDELGAARTVALERLWFTTELKMSQLARLLIAFLAAFCYVTTAKYVPGISYIDDVQLSYNNGEQWLTKIHNIQG